ncbi:hypothetical protein F1559_002830 [Cyanidiococcus yangmingshanensis]|uniref:Uncharacterized protein n=1 Tax=Cyanidiococcus yangmingshanensis TaxID=2690220 RepID=A0A7J7ID51_9RHOD|nr:hypothetical protein F1559_002830 [Cyanidiococcus yangmingshanensis]
MGSETQLGTAVTASSRESASEQSGTASAESRKTLPRIASTGSDLHRVMPLGSQPNLTASYSDFIAQQQQYQQQQRSISGGGLRHSSSWGSFVAVPPYGIGYGGSGGGCMPPVGSGVVMSDTTDLVTQNAYLRNELNRAQTEIQALRNRLCELEMSPGLASGNRVGSERGSAQGCGISVAGKGSNSGPASAVSPGTALSAPSPLHLSTTVPYGVASTIPTAAVGAMLPNSRGMAGMPVALSSSPLHLPAWRPERFSPSPPPGAAAAAAYTSSVAASARGNVSSCPLLSSGASSSSGRLGIAAKTALARHDSLGSISKDSHNSLIDEYGTGGYSSSSASSHRLGERRRSQSAPKRRGRASSVGSAREGGSSQPRYWTPEEHQRFLEALEMYGSRNVRAISEYVGTRNATQVRTHAQKYFLRQSREAQNRNSDAPQ